jgi:heme exporter protein D
MYQMASLAGVLRIILWFFVIYFTIRLIIRIAAPVVIKKSQEALMREMERQNARRSQQSTANSQQVNNKKNDPEGEYVDFIEIKD